MERAPGVETMISSVTGEDAASSGAWHRTRDGGSRREAWVKIARDIRLPNHYHALLELAGETPETAAQIEKDLPRTGATFAAQGFQLNPGEPTWRALRNILTAYAAHDPETGYVQSMNFLAAFLVLAGLDEEDAFWCLVALVTKIVPGYFSEGMAAAKLDQRVFCRLVHAHLPAVGLHLETIAPENIVPAIISSQWLLTLFVNVLPAGATMRVWDRVFESETRAPLFACALALLEPNAEAIMACDEMGETVELLQSLGESLGEAASESAGGAGDAGDGVVSRPGTPGGSGTLERPDAASHAREDALVARTDAYLAGACAPNLFLKEVGRERGRGRRRSDDGLPEAVKRAVPAVTEIDELVDGLRSDVLDVVGERALAREDAEAEAREEAERAARRDARREASAVRSSNADSDADSDADDPADGWELTAGPKAIDLAWAEELLEAGSATTRGVVSDVKRARRVFFPEASRSASGPSDPETETPRRLEPAAFSATEDGARHVDEASSATSHPALARAYVDVARTVAFAPVRAFAEAFPRLRAEREAFDDALAALREASLATQRAAAAAAAGDEDAGLAWRPGSGARDGDLPLGGPAWNAWADSAFEHAVRLADETLDGLRGVARALDRVAEATRGGGESPEATPAFGPREPARDEPEPAFGLAPSASRVAACAAAHETRVAAALRTCASAASAIAEDAARDLPLLAANRARVAEELRREVRAASAAIATWSAAAESRRRRKTKAALDAMRDAAAAAFAAFEAETAERAAAAAATTPGSTPATPGSTTRVSETKAARRVAESDPASLAASFALEDAQLESASVSLGAAARTVSRRKNAVARERAAAEAVRAHAEGQARRATRRAARLERAAEACEASLRRRSDAATLRERVPALESAVAAFGKASAAFVRDAIVSDILPWLDEALDAAALAYVAVADVAAQRLDAYADACAARAAERAAKERRRPSLGAEGRAILGGLLEDAAEIIAPRGARPAAEAAEARVDPPPGEPPGATRAELDAGAASAASAETRRFPLLRDRSAEAFASLAFGVEHGVAKISGALQGSAVGGALAKTFGGKKETRKEKDRGFAGGTERGGGASPEDVAEPRGDVVGAEADPGGSPANTAGPASASASTPRESRALREARDDLRRLETRRDELLEKKKRLRAFLMPAREKEVAR